MSDEGMTFNGMAALKARLAVLAAGVKPAIAAELKALGDEIMKDSKDNYCPVQDPPENDVVLRDTGRVDDPEIDADSVSVRLSYGGGAHAYAIAIHEHLSQYSPPSWRGKAVTFRVGGPKYLELPVMAHSRDLPVAVTRALYTFEGVVAR